jgi:hypothetical protein
MGLAPAPGESEDDFVERAVQAILYPACGTRHHISELAYEASWWVRFCRIGVDIDDGIVWVDVRTFLKIPLPSGTRDRIEAHINTEVPVGTLVRVV